MDEKQYLSVDGNSASGDVEALVRERVHSLYYDRDVNCARTTMLCLGELLGFHIEEQTYAARLGCTARAASGRSAAWWRER